MKTVTFLVKPASGLCNMRCRYCFYEDISGKRQAKNFEIMSRQTAECLIQSAFACVNPGDFVHFLFQGGEPTLAGLDFFKDFLELESIYSHPGLHISHSIQTNGTVLDSLWAAFFKENQFLTGLSLDGNKDLHDRFRTDSNGNGTWKRAKKALSVLDEHGVDTNLLCVVTALTARSTQKVYQSLKKLGPHPLQFIPCLDPLEEKRGGHDYSLTPEAYGSFLKSLFDCWHQDWLKGEYVSIRFFDDCIRLLMEMSPSSCAMTGSCGNYLVVEADGSLYPCDFYVLDHWFLGNIHTASVAEALSSPAAYRFLAEGNLRPKICKDCLYLPLCRGGCKRDWQWTVTGPDNYYCKTFKDFFDYSLPRFQSIIRGL